MRNEYDCGFCSNWVASHGNIVQRPPHDDCSDCILPDILKAILSLRPTLAEEEPTPGAFTLTQQDRINRGRCPYCSSKLEENKCRECGITIGEEKKEC